MARRVAFPFLLLLSVMLVGCDHATKALAVHHLAGAEPLPLWPGVIELTFTGNHDTAFSLLSRLGHTPSLVLLVALMVVAIAMLGVQTWRRWPVASATERVGYAIALPGAAGNLIDRVARGYVVDFVHVQYWPVFNVADVLLVVGLGLIVLASLRRRTEQQASPP